MVTLAELKLTLYEMGGERAVADCKGDNDGPASPCPLPLHPVTFTFACRGHSITLASSWQLSYLYMPIHSLFRQNSGSHHGLCISTLFLDLSSMQTHWRHCVQCKNSPFKERLKNTSICSVTKQSRRGGCYSRKYWEMFSVCSYIQCYLMAWVHPVWCREPL